MTRRTAPTTDQIRRFADYMQEDWGARKILPYLSTLTEHPQFGYTTVRDIQKVTNFSHKKILEIFKRLSGIGVGFIVPGRHGYPTRLHWACALVELVKSVAAELDRRESEPEEEAADGKQEANFSEPIEHTFVLRPGYVVRIALPSDVSKNESERLSNWMRTLAFG